jgi:hypothetical protein
MDLPGIAQKSRRPSGGVASMIRAGWLRAGGGLALVGHQNEPAGGNCVPYATTMPFA